MMVRLGRDLTIDVNPSEVAYSRHNFSADRIPLSILIGTYFQGYAAQLLTNHHHVSIKNKNLKIILL